MDHQHDTNCKCKSNVAAQSLDEMDFEKGIWAAGMIAIVIKERVSSFKFVEFSSHQ